MEEKFDVTGMTCAACQANVTRVVSKLDGVSHCDVSLLSNSMKVEFDQDKVNEQVICEAVKQIGYGASVHGEKGEVKKEWQNRQNRVESDQRSAKQRLILSLVLLIPLLVIAMGPMVGLPILEGMEWMMVSALTQLILCLFILFIQRHFFITGFKALMKKSANMDSLVAMGSGASFVYGLVGIYQMAYYFGVQNIEMAHMAMHSLYFESAATIVTLVSVGKYLESRSKAKTNDALDKLVDLAPKNATILRNGQEVVVSSESIRIHDIVVIRPGQRIPVDGKVVSGTGYVDQSAITGESLPVEKNVGDSVISATMNENGTFQFEAEKVGEDTTLAKIIQLVDDAGNSKAPIARLADKVSGVFVPVVILIALITFVAWLVCGQTIQFALSNAISVLVISCPCALGLATPVAIMVGTGKAAENGILIKSAAILEQLHSIDTIVLDKTGTITSGKPSVQGIKVYTNLSENDFISMAASLESGSLHPLGQAIVEYAKDKNMNLEQPENFTNISGRGIQAKLNGHVYLAGNKRLVEENKIELKANSTLPCSLYIDNFKVEGDFGDAVITVEPLNGKFIKNLIVNDKENSADWSINEKFENGAFLFGDRDVTAIDVPANLIGAEFVKTACDSKMFAEDLGTFTAGDDITIYIAVDNRVIPIIPEWLKNWTKTDDVLTATGNLTFTIFKNNFKSGEKVTLGTNGGTGDNANYVVFAKNMETVLNGKLIKNLQVFDSENAADWSIYNNTGVGSVLFGDRDITFTSFPENLVGAETVKTACDSKLVTTDLGVFTAGADITLYVAMDSRVTNPVPNWLNDWKNTGVTMSISNDLTYILYKQNFKSGEKVIMGTNSGSGASANYIFMAVPQEKVIKGDINLDGVIDAFDMCLARKGVIDGFTNTLSQDAADVDENGIVDINDLKQIQDYILARIKSFKKA